MLGGFALLAGVVLKFAGLSWRSHLGSLMFPNVGNMGLPLCLFAFGEKGFALALAMFVVISLAHFSVGMLIVSGQNHLGVLLKSPIIYAALIAVGMILLEWRLPDWLQVSLHLLGSFTIPLMLITLGVSLAGLRVTDFRSSGLLAVTRLSIGFCVGLAVSQVMGLTGELRGVVVLLSCMPAAVFSYLFAVRFRRDPEIVAGTVVLSTLMCFLLLPFMLSWLVV
jgi:predicted permease